MSKLTVKSGDKKITLNKSKALVGIKKKDISSRSVSTDYVDKEVFSSLGGFNVVTLKEDEASINVDEKLDSVRAREDVEVGTHVYFAEGSDKPLVPTGEIYMSFEVGVSEEEQLLLLNEYSLEIVERRSETFIVVKVTPKSPNPIKVASILQETSLVNSAEPDLDAPVDEYTFVSPQDHLLDHEWHLKNLGTVADVNYPLKPGADAKVIDAWNRLGSMGSSDVKVAVIDNGFDVSHPDLRHKVVKPYNIWDKSSNLPQGDNRYTHGTPCASVALASSNGQGIVGVAPNALFIPIHGTTFGVRATEEMFEYCIKNDADIISCSWGTTDPTYNLGPIKSEAIAKAAREGRNGKGCIVVFAVGNDDIDYVNYYSAHPDVIAVAASTSQDDHPNYSNRGREVSVCAPSNGDWPILAARAWWDEGIPWETGNYKYWRDGRSRGRYYKHFGGTSSATPLVAGVCALMLSANPDLTAKEVKEILQKTADKIGSPSEYSSNGHSSKYGYGRVNADKAVAEALRRKESVKPKVEVENTISSGQGLFRFDVEKQKPEGWGVQIGAFYEYGNVLIQAEKLQSQFGEPIIVNINELKGKTVYKIVVGAYSSKEDAQKLSKSVKASGIDNFIRNLADLA